jgi:hypothetical protein
VLGEIRFNFGLILDFEIYTETYRVFFPCRLDESPTLHATQSEVTSFTVVTRRANKLFNKIEQQRCVDVKPTRDCCMHIVKYAFQNTSRPMLIVWKYGYCPLRKIQQSIASQFAVFLTVHRSIDLFQLPTSCTIPLFYNNIRVYYIIILDMFRAC